MIELLRVYTNKGYVGMREAITDPVKYFDSVIAKEVANGEYVFDENELDILAKFASVTGTDGRNITTKYGIFQLKDIEDAVKVILTVTYRGRVKKDAVVVATKGADFTYENVGRMLDEAEKYDIGLGGVCPIPKEWDTKTVKVNDSFEHKMMYAKNFIGNSVDWEYNVKINFEVRGHVFDINTGTRNSVIMLDKYKYKMFTDGFTRSAVKDAKEVILGTPKMAAELEKIANGEDLYNMFKGATIVDLDCSLLRALMRARRYASNGLDDEPIEEFYTYLGICKAGAYSGHDMEWHRIDRLDDEVMTMDEESTRYKFVVPNYTKESCTEASGDRLWAVTAG